jgi:hypothetical protein
MYKRIVIALLSFNLFLAHASANEPELEADLAHDLVELLRQYRSSAGQSLAFLQKYPFDYKNENLNWGQNGNVIRHLTSPNPLYVFNQGNSIVGVAGQLPQAWLMQLENLRTVRCQVQHNQESGYICHHQSATDGTLEQFQYRVRYFTAQQRPSLNAD